MRLVATEPSLTRALSRARARLSGRPLVVDGELHPVYAGRRCTAPRRAGSEGRRSIGAATSASPAVLERLLAAGASVHTRDESGATPLLRATSNPAALQVLLAAGAEIDATESSGWSSLHVATMNGALAGVRALLDHGARLDLRDEVGYDALMMASEHGRLELVELLLAHGARVAATNRRGEDALAIARRQAEQAPLDSAAARVRLRLYKAVRGGGGGA